MTQAKKLIENYNSNSAYEQLVEDWQIDNAIAEAEAEYNQSGILLDAEEVFDDLRRKYFE